MKKRFREVSDANLDEEGSRPGYDDEPEPEQSTFLSRLMAKSQKVEEEEGEEKKEVFFFFFSFLSTCFLRERWR
jgi:hypothetical protein